MTFIMIWCYINKTEFNSIELKRAGKIVANTSHSGHKLFQSKDCFWHQAELLEKQAGLLSQVSSSELTQELS